MTDKKKPNMHPNSLANLGRPWSTEEAKAAQLLGAKKRSENALKRKAIREDLKLWNEVMAEVLEEDISGFDTMKTLMAKYIHEGEWDQVQELASKLAEYEKPKLARQEVSVDDNKTSEMTDEELDAKLKELLKK